MDMSPDDAPDMLIAIDNFQKFVTVTQSHPIQPATAHRYWLVMQTHERMVRRVGRQSPIQEFKLIVAQPSSIVSVTGAV